MRGMESYPKAAMERAMKVQDDSHFPPSRRRLVNQNQTSHVLRKADILACLQTGSGALSKNQRGADEYVRATSSNAIRQQKDRSGSATGIACRRS